MKVVSPHMKTIHHKTYHKYKKIEIHNSKQFSQTLRMELEVNQITKV